MACLLAAGFLGIASMANDASAGKSIRKRDSGRNFVLEMQRRGRGARIPLPMGPSSTLLRLPLLLQPRALPDAYRGLCLLSPQLLHPRFVSRSWILSAPEGARALVAMRWQMQRKQIDVETCKARLEDIEARLKLGKLNEAEADAARLALLSQLRSSSRGFGQHLRRQPDVIGPAAVFLLVAGVGATVSHVEDAPEAAGSADTNSGPRFRLGWRNACEPHGLHALHRSRRPASTPAGGAAP